MRYRVINKKTKEDITEQYDWVITPNGKLSYIDGGDLIGHPDAMHLPEKLVGEFYHTVKVLNDLKYYDEEKNIK